ncbi:glycosyltransferase family 4 protein [Marinibaculum pumilum]|uniref:Glycosyltransferase family 4 protein n=1 Tax=Marinibaculum pumilum TaxID=1766165 RepID=A0ABV7L4V7_9PROT
MIDPPSDRDPPGPASRPLRLLLLSPAAEMPGGVAEYVGMILHCLSPAVVGERFAIGRRPGEGGHSPWRMLRDYLRFAVRLLGRDRPDVLHVNPTLDRNALPRDALFLVLARLRRPRAVIVTFHGWRQGTERRLLSPGPTGAVLRLGMRLALRGADRVQVLAEPYRQALLKLGLEAERVATTSTMFDGRLFGGRLPDDRLSDDRLSDDRLSDGEAPAGPGREAGPRRRILFLSRFVAGKGGAELIEAFGVLHAAFPEFRLTMAGDGPLAAEWRQLAAASPARAAIDFPGYVSGAAKARLLQDALLFVLPSATEGMPVSLLEAMAAGAAALVTPVGGIPLVVRPGQTGAFLETADAAGIAAALRDMLASPGLVEGMGRAAAELAWQHYESAQVVARLERLYLETAAARRR